MDEFVKGFQQELDFESEARLHRLFYERSRDTTMWSVPALFTSSKRILEMEYIEDARKDAVSEDDLEPLFRSAEGYLRMWEKAEARGRALRGE